MKLSIIATKGTPADRDIEYLQRRLADRQVTPEVLDADSRPGIALAELYDAMGRPAVIATTDDGILLQKWEGAVPSFDEVNPYIAGA